MHMFANIRGMDKFYDYSKVNLMLDFKGSKEKVKAIHGKRLHDHSLKKAPKDYQIAWNGWYTYRLRMWKKVGKSAQEMDEEEIKQTENDLELKVGDDELLAEDKLRDYSNIRQKNSNAFSDDLVGYELMCDRVCIQNATCFELPSRFIWDDNPSLYTENRFGTFDETLRSLNIPNTDHPFYIHPEMKLAEDYSESGLFCNGLDFIIGCHVMYDLISIDVRVPPLAQLSLSCWNEAWESNEDVVSPYRSWKYKHYFEPHVWVYKNAEDPAYDDGLGIKQAWGVDGSIGGIHLGDLMDVFEFDGKLPYEHFAWHFDNMFMLTNDKKYSFKSVLYTLLPYMQH